MNSTLLTQQTIPLTRVNDLQVAQAHTCVQNEELTIDCPDCFDTMVKIYDSYKIRYQCENCDLIMSEIGVQGFNV